MIGYLLPALSLAALVWLLLDVAIFYPAKIRFEGNRIVRITGGTLLLTSGASLTVANCSAFSAGDYLRIGERRRNK